MVLGSFVSSATFNSAVILVVCCQCFCIADGWLLLDGWTDGWTDEQKKKIKKNQPNGWWIVWCEKVESQKWEEILNRIWNYWIKSV